MLRNLLVVAASASLLASCALISGALAGEGFLPVSEPAGTLSPSDIARFVEQLDAPDFGERQEASLKLSEAGRSVFPDLEKAATTPIREVSGRALDILKLHFQRGDAELKQAAKESLVRLAESKNGSLAQRARNVFDPPKEIAASNPFGPGFRGAPVQNVFPPPGPPTRTISISEINGKREVEIKDEARNVKMQTWPNGRIEIDVEEKNNAQPKKLHAKDLDDLKAKDAEIAALYEQSQQRGRLPAGAVPPLPALFGALPAANADLAKQMLDLMDVSIERYKARLPNDPNAQRTIDSLERLKQQYRNTLPPAAAPALRPVETARRPVAR